MYIEKDNMKFLDSNCYFKNCRISSGHGAALFVNGNSAVIQRRLCSIRGFVNRCQGSHSYTELKSGSNLPNLVVESSISQHKGENIYSVFYFFNGITGIYSTNSSNNDVFHGSGHQNYSPIQESITNYSSFCHNNNSHNFVLLHGTGLFKDLKCNFVDNEGNDDRYFTVDHSEQNKDFYVESCSFVGPYGSAMIFKYAIVKNCNIDDISKIGSDAITYNINAITVTYKLGHYSTTGCEAKHTLMNYNFDLHLYTLYLPMYFMKVFLHIPFLNPCIP